MDLKGSPDFERLFNPKSLAIVGASKDLEKSGGNFLKGLIDRGFKEKLYPVNPKESEIMGLKTYHSIGEIPDEIDLAIFTIPAQFVPQAMSQCSQKGVKFVIVHSAGFSELGPDGKRLEQEMLCFARQGSVRVIGPNCMGMYSPSARINTVLSGMISDTEAGPVAFAGQSGWVTENVIQLGFERGLRFSKVVSIGNQSDLAVEDLLEYLGDDPATRVIAFYIEGIKNARKFLSVATRVSKKKPVIVWKGGRTKIGARAAASHTGSLAGDGIIVDAALTQSGAIIARNLEELLDLAVGFTCPVLPKGKRLGLLVEAGGGAVSGSDAAESLGLEIPVFPEQIQNELVARLTGAIPPFSRPRNPVDLVWSPATDAVKLYTDCMRIMMKAVDSILVVSYLNYDTELAKAAGALRDEMAEPIFMVPGHVAECRQGMGLLAKSGIPTFTLPDRAIKTLSALISYANYHQE